VPDGGEVSSAVSFPQQARSPSVWIPQAKVPPALTWLKVPDGGEVSPAVSFPQQARSPSVWIPQAKVSPALIDDTPGAAGSAVRGVVTADGAAPAVAPLVPATTRRPRRRATRDSNRKRRIEVLGPVALDMALLLRSSVSGPRW
jgi:hypothetical protein